MPRYPGKAMVLGGAEGLGAAFARQLAAAGYDLCLVDRAGEELEATAGQLRRRFGRDVQTRHLDLLAEEAPQRVAQWLRAEPFGLMVYVAAYSQVGPFLKLTEAQRRATLTLNVARLVELCRVFAAACRARDQAGGLILVSSLAGGWGLPLVGLYGATKAFIWNLAESLHEEWRPHGLDVLALLCGAMDTPGLRRTRPDRRGLMLEDPETAAREGLRYLGRGPVRVAGWRSRLVFFGLSRLLPRRWARRLMARQVRKMYGN